MNSQARPINSNFKRASKETTGARSKGTELILRYCFFLLKFGLVAAYPTCTIYSAISEEGTSVTNVAQEVVQ